MPEAIKWFKRAAELNHALACACFGIYLSRLGDGVEADAHTSGVTLNVVQI